MLLIAELLSYECCRLQSVSPTATQAPTHQAGDVSGLAQRGMRPDVDARGPASDSCHVSDVDVRYARYACYVDASHAIDVAFENAAAVKKTRAHCGISLPARCARTRTGRADHPSAHW